MKKFLSLIFLFFLAAIAIDLLFGFVMDKMFASAKNGEKAKLYYVANNMKEDVVIMGSSRAYRHYDPQVFEDSLHCSVYNAGCSNMGIICNYGLYKALSKKHKPTIIVYEVYNTDLTVSDNSQYLDNLRLFRHDKDIMSFIDSISPNEKWKLYSALYCYNTKWVYIVQENIKSSKQLDRGFEPYRGHMASIPTRTEENLQLDPEKISLLEHFIKDVTIDGVKLIFSISPFYYNKNREWISQAHRIAEKNDIVCIDMSKDLAFNEQMDLFYDQIHLNDKGASIFSKQIVQRINGLINESNSNN